MESGMNEHSALPQLIVVILDDDLVHDLHSQHLETKLNLIIKWLVNELDKSLSIYKDYLPQKAKKNHQPHILWMIPLTHKYFGHGNNNRCIFQGEIITNIVKSKQDMSILKMIKEWDHDNSQLYIVENDHFTSIGLSKYWASKDAAIQFWSVAVKPKIGFIHKRNKSHQKQKYLNYKT